MTVKQFYTDPFQWELETAVTAVEEVEGRFFVELRETIFYPEGGGQPADTGWINGCAVSHVMERAGSIAHVLQQSPGEPGATARCRVEWRARVENMQHHTGQHLLSAVLQKEYQRETVGFHLSRQGATLDIHGGMLSEAEIERVEAQVGEYIFQERSVATKVIPANQMKDTTVRGSAQLEGDVRLVEIEGLDCAPCCGTHLSHTGQIGWLKVVRAAPYKGGARLHFLCGQRAFRDYAAKHGLIRELTDLLTTGEKELAARVAAELERTKQQAQKIKELQGNLAQYRAAEAVSRAESPLVQLEAAAMDEAQALSQAVQAQGPFLAVIVCGEKILLAHDGSLALDCGAFVKQRAPSFGGRGGGNSQAAQAFFPEADGLERFRTQLQDAVIR